MVCAIHHYGQERSFYAARESAVGVTRTCRNVRNPVAMGWQADFEVAALNRLDL
jgi:hypothetical protein